MDYRNELCILINQSLERAREYRKLKWKRDQKIETKITPEKESQLGV